jgi:hypothetical protein
VAGIVPWPEFQDNEIDLNRARGRNIHRIFAAIHAYNRYNDELESSKSDLELSPTTSGNFRRFLAPID